MKVRKLFYVLLILVLPSFTIELLTGSTPPLYFFNPITIIFLVIAYGIPFMMIRELKIRWELDWSYMFLFPIMGIFIEGIFMQSFFNTGHIDLGELSGFGMYYGVQWPWTIYLIIIHGLYSLVVPMYMVDFFFPEMKKKPILSKKGFIASCVFLFLLIMLQYWVIITEEQAMYMGYNINIVGTLICLLVIVSLVVLAYMFRRSKLQKKLFRNRFVHHFYGFLYVALVILATFIFIEATPMLTIIAQLIMAVILIRYALKHIYGTKREFKDFMPLFNGTLMFFALFAILQENVDMGNPDSTVGMSLVGISFVGLIIIMNIIQGIRNRKQ